MDLATVFGFLLAWGAVIYSMFHCTEGHLDAYFKPGEIFLVFGGSLGAALLSMPLHSVTGAISYLKKFMLNKEAHIEQIIKEMVQYAETARRDGVLALESVAREAPDAFLRRGLQLFRIARKLRQQCLHLIAEPDQVNTLSRFHLIEESTDRFLKIVKTFSHASAGIPNHDQRNQGLGQFCEIISGLKLRTELRGRGCFVAGIELFQYLAAGI